MSTDFGLLSGQPDLPTVMNGPATNHTAIDESAATGFYSGGVNGVNDVGVSSSQVGAVGDQLAVAGGMPGSSTAATPGFGESKKVEVVDYDDAFPAFPTGGGYGTSSGQILGTSPPGGGLGTFVQQPTPNGLPSAFGADEHHNMSASGFGTSVSPQDTAWAGGSVHPPVVGGGGGLQGSAPLPKMKSKSVTRIFRLPIEERRFKDENASAFEERNVEKNECNAISKKTNTSIELCESRDHCLTICISGERHNVEEARKQIIQKLQTQASREIRIPKEHHRVLIGKEGRKLAELESQTDCRIMLPNRDQQLDTIRIIGPREGIDRAVHQIEIISAEQSKLALEKIYIERIYYPWIMGPNNETVDDIMARTKAKIHIPPPLSDSEFVVVNGEKDGVYQALGELRQIYEEKRNNSQTVSIQVTKSQHRYVIGPGRSGLAEILRETGVSVEVPPQESESDQITLRGESTSLGRALTKVYEKASSIITDEISCPVWLHKFIRGPRMSHIKAIIGDQPANRSVQVQFEHDGYIFLEGPPEIVKRTKKALEELTQELENELAFNIVDVHPDYHRHIIGKGGANISRIKEETGVLVTIPDESTRSHEIRLEGKKEGVARATEMIQEIATRMENEKSRDIKIEQRFHRQLIGTRGEALAHIRENYPGVNVSFPEQGRKSDTVSLRGPKDEVDKCYKHLQTIVKDLIENNYQFKVPIFKEFHRFIIGKGGQNIKKIREETDTRIEIPSESSVHETDITVTGKRANVEKAVKMLNKIQNDLESVITTEISIPAKIHSSLLAGSGRLVHAIQEECGGVTIKFPPENAKSDKITLRGPKEDVEKAKIQLSKLAKDKELSSHTDVVKAKPEYHGFLIGRGGATIGKIRESYPNVRILFPRSGDSDQETIHLIGTKDEIAAVKTQLDQIVNNLQHTVEETVEVDPKWHRHFVGRAGAVLREIQAVTGGCAISFPPQATKSHTVTLKGARECVDEAKRRIEEIVDNLESAVTIRAEIPQQYHRVLLGNRGAHIQEITSKFNVQIKFPERAGSGSQQHYRQNASTQQQQEQHAAGDNSAVTNGQTTGSNEDNAGVETDSNNNNTKVVDTNANSSDYVLISGRKEKCDEAEAAMRELIPISENMDFPYDYHRMLIGQGGTELRKLMQEHDVNIAIPPRDDHSNIICISGRRANVAEAKVAIAERLTQIEAGEKERELRSFKVVAKVPQSYHSRIIGPKGKMINDLRNQFDVFISIPKPDAPNPDEIVITGYEDKANAAKEHILKMIGDYESMCTQDITLDCRVHPRIIGIKGRSIRKIMEDFKVEIRFPRQSDPDPNAVVVIGKDEDAVYDCIDHLRNMEEEYLQDVNERHQYSSDHASSNATAGKDGTGAGDGMAIVFRNAPWQASADSPTVPPDTSNMEDFPSMGLDGVPVAGSGGGGGADGANGTTGPSAMNGEVHHDTIAAVVAAAAAVPASTVAAPRGVWGAPRRH